MIGLRLRKGRSAAGTISRVYAIGASQNPNCKTMGTTCPTSRMNTLNTPSISPKPTPTESVSSISPGTQNVYTPGGWPSTAKSRSTARKSKTLFTSAEPAAISARHILGNIIFFISVALSMKRVRQRVTTSAKSDQPSMPDSK